jgi:hypothetical protein
LGLKTVLDPSDKPHGRTAPSPRELALFAEALLMLSLASLAIRLPFRWLTRLMSMGRADGSCDKSLSCDIVKAVGRAGRRLPWRTVCFQQGLATHWMHRRRGAPSILHYGARTGQELAAHVWVSVDGDIVIGEAEAASHACIATFPADGR